MRIETLSAGVDWFSTTADYPSEECQHIRENGLLCLDMVERQGYERKERSMQGYEGVSCGNCFVGARDDGMLVQFTGIHSNAAFASVYHHNARVPRLDVQVTVKYRSMPDDIAKMAYRLSCEWALTRPAHMRPNVRIYTGNDGGETTYIGSPSSEQRGRIYNKEVQSEDPAYTRSWRWEVTFKNAYAKRVSRTIYGSGDRVGQVCRDIVGNWFKSRGCNPEWINQCDVIVIEPERTIPTDIERKLWWLEKQVKPTIRYLQSRGFGDMIAETLGLSSS